MEREQVQIPSDGPQQANEEKEDILKLTIMFSDIASELSATAEWYESHHTASLAEQCRYVQRGILDIVELAETECESLDDVDELLDMYKQDTWNMYKFLQSENFDHLADLAMCLYIGVCELIAAVERNK